MNEEKAEDDQWAGWFEVQRKAVNHSINGSLRAAIEEVNGYLRMTSIRDIRRRAVGFRGDLWEESGDLAAAKIDFMAAHELSEDADYERYTLELALGCLNKKQKANSEAISWYLKALETANANPGISGVEALAEYVKLLDQEKPVQTERDLMWRVARKAWTLLKLEGAPNLDDLAATLKILKMPKGGESGNSTAPRR
ncbi:MAG: hypothetical protein HC897_14080 [Thermoanaerobaculia bacterium]|nr:hypothetical protein [Thermoanaerobaculia bacterium]